MDYKRTMNQRSAIVAKKRAQAEKEAQKAMRAQKGHGLLAMANAYLEVSDFHEKQLAKELADMEEQQQMAEIKAVAKCAKEPYRIMHQKNIVNKLKKCVSTFVLGLTISTALPYTTINHNNLDLDQLSKIYNQKARELIQPAPVVQDAIQNFQQGLQSRVSEADRDILAQMVYGEAGTGTDPFEVIHTVLNRMSSPLFSGNMTDVVTQKNQYIGYNKNNPITKEYRRMVDIAVEDWEAHGCQAVEGCDHYYFVTGEPGKSNRFEISPDHQGQWVPQKDKQYAKLRHYCPIAEQQAKLYFGERNQDLTR